MACASNSANDAAVNDEGKATGNQNYLALKHAKRAQKALRVCLIRLKGLGSGDLKSHCAYRFADRETLKEARGPVHAIHRNKIAVVINHDNRGVSFLLFHQSSSRLDN